MGKTYSCCAKDPKYSTDIENDIYHKNFVVVSQIHDVSPDILMRDDVVLISKFGSLEIIIKKLERKLKIFQTNAKLVNNSDINSSANSTDLKSKTKYLLLTEKLTIKLKNKKKHVREQIANLKASFNNSNLQSKFKSIFESKKIYTKYDESLDKISEEIFEIERSYQNEYPEIIANKSNSKITHDEASKKALKTSFRLSTTKSLKNIPRSDTNMAHFFDDSKKKESQNLLKNFKNPFGANCFEEDNVSRRDNLKKELLKPKF